MEKRETVEVKRTELVLRSDTNHYGTIFGGKTLAMMDMTGALAAMRFSNENVVTASFESIDFNKPIKEGDIVEVVAKVIYTSRTSLVVKIDVYKFQNQRFHSEKKFACGGYATFVAIDMEGNTHPIPQLIVETDEEKRLWDIGEKIKKNAVERAKG
ncbi:MAG: acyl-CoA thioesterase [Thermodesulfobacteriota bacterium]